MGKSLGVGEGQPPAPTFPHDDIKPPASLGLIRPSRALTTGLSSLWLPPGRET